MNLRERMTQNHVWESGRRMVAEMRDRTLYKKARPPLLTTINEHVLAKIQNIALSGDASLL